jgi:peptide/nickel transport system ATP-binding protein
MTYLLQVQDLVTRFFTDDGVVTAVDQVSFNVRAGEVVGIVGESGCGKSVASLSILRLIQDPPGRITSGKILFEGRDLLTLSDEQMRRIRGNDIAMIFQEPMTSFNPVYTIGNQIGEAIALHQQLDKAATREKTIEMLKLVGISRPGDVVDEYPHRFSGGMRQRAMIAMALSCNPRLLIADEPTTALDVTIQAQILELMKDLKRRINTAIIFITHDLGVIAEIAQTVVVMYAGRVVENTDVVTLFREPRHPYTIGLFASKPRIEDDQDTLDFIPGMVPNPLHMPRGCRFHPRCGRVMDICTQKEPPEIRLGENHFIRCWLYDGPAAGNNAAGEPL